MSTIDTENLTRSKDRQLSAAPQHLSDLPSEESFATFAPRRRISRPPLVDGAEPNHLAIHHRRRAVSPADSVGIPALRLQLVGRAVVAGRELHILLDGNRRRLPSLTYSSRIQMPAMVRTLPWRSSACATCRNRRPVGLSSIASIISIRTMSPIHTRRW